MKSTNYELYEKESDNSQLLDNKFVEIKNKYGLKKAIEFLKENGAIWLDINSYVISYLINEFTKKDTSKEKIDSLISTLHAYDEIKSISIVDNEEYKTPELIIKRNDVEIKVIQLSKFLPQVKEMFPDIEDSRREQTCYDKAYNIALNLGIDADVVTGYIFGYTDKSRYLHSICETTLFGKKVVIDGAFNAIINKDGYYAIKHFKQLTRISVATIKNDINQYLHSIGKIPLTDYLVFRDEIIKNIEKNKDIFDKSK